MTDPADIIVPEIERQRQAVAAIRGYVYQIYASALAWASLADDEILLLEVADDFAIATREALTLTQVKDTPGAATTLRNPGVIDTINGYWRVRADNRSLQVRAVYLTTSSFGRERNTSLPNPRKGLEEWRSAATEGYPLAALKTLLLSLPLEPDLLAWLGTAADETVRNELLRPMRWEGGQPDLAGLDELLSERLILNADRQGLQPSDARRARDAVLHAVMLRIVDPSSRRLTSAQFLQTFEAATSVSMPISAARRAMSGARDAAEALDRLNEALIDVRSLPQSSLHVERPAVTGDLLETLTAGHAVWLHGSSGSGKTTVAVDAVRTSNRGWYLIELRDLKADAVADRLKLARRAIGLRDFGGLILDDVPTAGLPKAGLQLTLLVAALRQADAGLIVTAYRAPPPSLSATLSERLRPQELPSLEEDEVGAVIARAGGNAARWKRVTWLSSGGHPQLVAARVTGLKARNWPSGEDLDGLLPSLRAMDLDSERDAVRERLIDELPDRPRALLFRLSLALGGFDRTLAVAMGAASPALPQPGEALDFLVGPWIETSRPGRYRVSPLVADAGARSLSAQEQNAVHLAICDDIAGRRPIPGEHINQLLISGLVTAHAEALRIVALSVIMTKDKDREAVLQHLEPLALFQTTAPLVESDPEVSALLRLAQLKVAIAGSSAATARRIFQRLLVEIEGSARAPAFRQAAVFAVLISQTCPLEPDEWFSLVRQMEEMELPIPPAQLEALRARSAYTGSEKPADFMFTWRAAHVSSVDELEKVFETLGTAEAAVRNRYLTTLNDTLASVRTFVQSPWVRDSERDGFDPASAADRYAGLEASAAGWDQAELAVQCVAARSTLLSEHASRHEDAIRVLEDAEGRWPNDPRLQRERIKIFFRLGQHGDVVEETHRYLAREIGDAIDRAHVLRELAVSTFRIGDPAEAARLFGAAAVEAATVPTMTDMQAGLLGDKAQVEFDIGRRETALRTLVEAARVADGIDRDAHRGGFVLRMIAGVAAWMVNQLAGGDAEASARLGACSGAASDLAWPNPVPHKEAIWYQAAAIERQLRLDVGVREAVELRVRGRRIAPFEASFGFSRLEDAALSTSEDELVDALCNVARIVTHVSQGGLASIEAAIHEVGEVMPWETLPVDLTDERIRSPIDDAVACFIVGNVLRDPEFDIMPLALRLDSAPDTQLLAGPVRSWRQGLEPAMDVLPATLAAAAVVVGRATGDAALLMLATFRIWEWLERSIPARRFEAALATRIAAQWLHLADKAQFALRTPVLTAPAIRLAARDTVDRRSIARLLLVANDAVSNRMGSGVRAALTATLN